MIWPKIACKTQRWNPGKGYPSILMSISATAYGVVLHSKCKGFDLLRQVRLFDTGINNDVIGIKTSSYWYCHTHVQE